MRAATRRLRGGDEGGVDLTPMLDVVFILLIFFLVTASFVRDSVVDVSRPDTTPRIVHDQETLIVGIGDDDRFQVAGRHVDIRRLGAVVARFLAEHPNGSVAIKATAGSSNGALVTAIDQARLSGAANVSLVEAAKRSL